MDTAPDVMPYVTAAIGAYGVGVLAKTKELAADTTVARGARILQRVFGRGDADARRVIGRVADAKPDDEPSLAALRSAIAAAFQADPHLSREVAAMLLLVTAGERPVAAADGVLITGDDAPR
ncbi:hypothetical protein ITP53_29740 [Nonomuraea sp. K274]|uniref:Uncharacterized protein n=1 Tax=Nonomuraea cypriaca TaxID=1187855 RepID=A0A931AEX3_9ACTN|nr:hypothetical protein [Nonomuraea cypriaca]MBF8189834.1 hypothetical protein [Nonomuraea cypriaca]